MTRIEITITTDEVVSPEYVKWQIEQKLDEVEGIATTAIRVNEVRLPSRANRV